MNTNKNIPDIVRAISKLKKDYPDILLLSLSAVSSNNIYSQGVYEEVISLINEKKLENNVIVFTNFLSDPEIEVILRCSDVNIWAYKDVGESASASIRKALASDNPSIVTDINMFSELKDEVLKIKDGSPEQIEVGIKKVLNDKDLVEKITSRAKEFIERYSYDRQALETLKEYAEDL